MSLAAMQRRVQQRIYQQGVPPDLAADVWQLAKACHLANRRWRPDEARWQEVMPDEQAEAPSVAALAEIPAATAPFCHDVLLYRAFLSPEATQDARRWLGQSMWALIEALGGWRRVHGLTLGRLHDEAMAALVQMPSFLRPPSYRLKPLMHADAWEMVQPWLSHYPSLKELIIGEMVELWLTAGAWLWIFHRTDAELGGGRKDGRDLAAYVMRLGRHVAKAVALVP